MSFDPYSSKLPAGGGPSGGAGGADKIDPKLINFLQKQQQTIKVMEVLTKVTELCWDTCDVNPNKDRLDGRTETCIRNCCGRYQDSMQFVMTRLQKMGGGQ